VGTEAPRIGHLGSDEGRGMKNLLGWRSVLCLDCDGLQVPAVIRHTSLHTDLLHTNATSTKKERDDQKTENGKRFVLSQMGQAKRDLAGTGFPKDQNHFRFILHRVAAPQQEGQRHKCMCERLCRPKPGS
jgi:hypothetical protein